MLRYLSGEGKMFCANSVIIRESYILNLFYTKDKIYPQEYFFQKENARTQHSINNTIFIHSISSTNDTVSEIYQYYA